MRVSFSCSPAPLLTRFLRLLLPCSPALLFPLLTAGCGDPDVLPRHTITSAAPQDSQRMLQNIADNLQRLADYGPPGAGEQKDIMEQVVERLNDWSPQNKQDVVWQRDDLIASLPPELQKGVLERAAEKKYDPFDAFFLREAVWLRDAAATAAATAGAPGVPQYYPTNDDRQKAAAIFDWTVRNIQLDSDEKPAGSAAQPGRFALRPWEVLLMGHGTAMERTWLFMLLARQQHLDVVLLATPDPKSPNQFRVWAPAHLHQGQLYLYDMGLGVAVPGAKGHGIATLKEAAEDESILAQLDLEGAAYPVRSKDIQKVLALAEADIPYLSQRFKLVEANLTGDRKIVLSTAPSQLARRLQSSPHVQALRIWPWPIVSGAERMSADDAAKKAFARDWTILSMPLVKHTPKIVEEGRESEDEPKVVVRQRIIYPLWSARQRHFQGRYNAPDKRGAGVESDAAQESAKSLYLDAREAIEGVRGPNAAAVPDERRKWMEDMRDFATYWLGLVNYDQGEFAVANQYFEAILKEGAKNRFYPGTLYNLARTRLVEGKTAEAIQLFENPAVSMPQGCRLRAKWLKGKAGPDDPQTEAAAQGSS